MKKKTLAIVFDSVNQTTGAFNSTKRFIRLLHKDYNIIFLTDKSSNTKRLGFPGSVKIYRLNSICLRFLPGKEYISLESKKNLREILIREGVRVVHVIMPTLIGMRVLDLARELNIKSIAHCHIQPDNLLLGYPFVFIYVFYRYLISFFRKADFIISPSDFSRNLLLSYYNGFDIKVISNGIDLDKFSVRKKNLSSKKILSVGRLSPEKNVAFLIRAMSSVVEKDGDVILEIVGSGPIEKRLRNLVFSLGLENNVKFLGRVSEKRLVRLYHDASLFVLPSFVELEGMVVLEAMASKNPVLISNSKDSASSYFVDGNGFLFDPKDQDDLVEKILKILGNKKLRREMAVRSFKIAKDYDIRNSLKKLKSLYGS